MFIVQCRGSTYVIHNKAMESFALFEGSNFKYLTFQFNIFFILYLRKSTSADTTQLSILLAFSSLNGVNGASLALLKPTAFLHNIWIWLRAFSWQRLQLVVLVARQYGASTGYSRSTANLWELCIDTRMKENSFLLLFFLKLKHEWYVFEGVWMRLKQSWEISGPLREGIYLREPPKHIFFQL